MNSDVILLQPKTGILDRLGERLPLGLLFVASLLDSRGYNVKIIDQRIKKNWKKILLKSLKNNPICTGIACITGPQIRYALEISKFVKKNSDVPVIWGGIHPTMLPEQTLKNENVDIVVCGEGEITFLELVRFLEKNKSLEGLEGIWYKKGGKIKKNQGRGFVDLNELPDMPYHLIDLKRYSAPKFSDNGRSLSFMSSRGCPFKCGFCYNNFFNKSMWRGFGVDKTIERLNHLLDHNVKSVYFVDDNICGNFKHFKGIVDGIIKEKIDISWGVQGIRMDSVSKMGFGFLRKIVKSGCKELDIGIESMSPRILSIIDKNLRIQDVEKVSKKLAGFPITVKYNFLVGLPTQKMHEIKFDINYALGIVKNNKNSYVLFNVYTPFPETPMFDLSIKCGFQPPDTLEDWSRLVGPEWVLDHPSWLSKNEAEFINNLSFVFSFANKNIKSRITKPLQKFLFDVYYPIAKTRLEHKFYKFLIEKKIVIKLNRMIK